MSKILLERIEKLETRIINEKTFLNEMKKIGIEKLPYAYSALDRFINKETMDVHYNKHYKGYVDKLNKAISKRSGGDKELEEIVKDISKYNKKIRDNAGGAFNHALFWKMLSPEQQKCSGDIYDKITIDFGSYRDFKSKFEDVAKKRFGSGWVWLVLDRNNKLKVISTPNQDNPLMDVVKGGGYPLLGLDLWEHAYYLKYLNKRDNYIKNFWTVVNWKFVNKLLKSRLTNN
jgi:Fe-Mn family superoxide dismutase